MIVGVGVSVLEAVADCSRGRYALFEVDMVDLEGDGWFICRLGRFVDVLLVAGVPGWTDGGSVLYLLLAIVLMHR
jgi:hypothetical protein